MLILKKLILAPLFLMIFTLLLYQLKGLFGSYGFIFSLDLKNMLQLVYLSLTLLFSALSFTLFVSFASSLKFIAPVIILSSLLPLLFIPTKLAVILMIGIIVCLLVIYLTLENTLKNYITFHPFSIFGPAIRNLIFLLIIVFSICYYLSLNSIIQKNGFQIPNSLTESALKFIPRPEIPTEPQTVITDEFLKATLKSQLDKAIKPYISFIPIFLAFLFFITFQTICSFLNILIYPLLALIFYLLEKSGFVKFIEEMRPVKKMVL